MTEGLPAPPFAGEPEAVARRGAARHRPRHARGLRAAVWALVMLVIRHLPRFVMRRVRF